MPSLQRPRPMILLAVIFSIVIYGFGDAFNVPILHLVGSSILSIVIFFFAWKIAVVIGTTRKKVGLTRKQETLLLVVLGLAFILAGLSANLLTGGINNYFQKGIGKSETFVAVNVAPITEETIKLIGVLIVVLGLMKEKNQNDILYVLIAGGLIVGLTFGFWETLTNVKYRAVFLERLLKSIPDYGLWTALLATGLRFPLIKYPKKLIGWVPFALLYLSAVKWHSLWNASAIPEQLQWISFIAVVVLVSWLIFEQFARKRGVNKNKLRLAFFISATFLILIGILCYVFKPQNQVILSLAVLFVSALTLYIVIRQTELVRRTLYGEIYENPPLERVAFIDLRQKPNRRVHFGKPIDGDLFEEAMLPRNSKVPLCITWRTKAKQSLRHIQFGFEQGYNGRPRVTKKLSGWVAKEIKPLQTAEYIDLDGYYHVEYPTPRKFGRESAFVNELEIETGGSGNFDFHIEVYSEEAKESFKKILKVIVK